MDSADDIKDPRIMAHKKRFQSLSGSDERAHVLHHWEEIAEVMSPRKTGIVGQRTPGIKRNDRLFDPTGVHSVELLTSGLHGVATNPAAKWFSLRLIDTEAGEDQEVLQYLSTLEDRMWSELYSPGTHFTTAIHEAYHDLVAFGTACVFVAERGDGKLLFQARPLSEIVIAENADGLVDTVYRCSEYTVDNLMEKAQGDWNKPSDNILERAREGKLDDKIKVMHVVGPRRDRDYFRKDAANKPIESVYFELETGHLLYESGFDAMPYLVPRWIKLPGEIYGRSPAMTALPDVKMLQQMAVTLIKTAQKTADPTIFMPSDGNTQSMFRLIPGGINFYKGRGQDLVTLPVGNIPLTQEVMEGVRNRIRTTMYVDVLQMFTPDANMTATEVMQRTQERLRLMGPVVGRLEAEMLGPLVTRVYSILKGAGRLPEPPEALSEQEWSVEYVSPIATAQKAIEGEGILKAATMFGAFGEQGLMELAKGINFDRARSYAWKLYNIEPDLLMTEEELEQRNQQEQAAITAAQAPQVAGAAADGARAIKDLGAAQQEGGIDMNQLMGMAGGMPQQAAEMEAGGAAALDDDSIDIEQLMGAGA